VKLLLQSEDPAGAALADALRSALPGASVVRWPQPCPDADYLLVWQPPPEALTHVRSVRAIFNIGAGVDALLASPALPVGVPLIRLEDAGMAEQMAEYVTLAVLRAYRESDAYATQQRERRWQKRERLPKRAFGVGILGFGVLGRAVAAALAPFGFPLAGYSRERKSIPGVASFAGATELPAFLARSHVLVCMVPSTPSTRDLLDRTRLGALPRGAHVVNVARGDIVVDADLVALLDEGHLGGATLDTFRTEPLPGSHPFWHHPRIVVTPHVSAATLVDASVVQIADKIGRLERGEPVGGVVDRARGY
jgi:glyoxylate/hydroxypyruvate reductase A